MVRIKGSRFGTVSSRRSAKDTAADVVYYNDDDSGLQFRNKRIKQVYNRAKDNYSFTKRTQDIERAADENPTSDIQTYIHNRQKPIGKAITYGLMSLTPLGIGSVAISLPELIGGIALGTIGYNYGAKKGAEIDQRRHGYTNNEEPLGLAMGAITGATGSQIGRLASTAILNQSYRAIPFNIRNFREGLADYKSYKNRPDSKVVYSKGKFKSVAKGVKQDLSEFQLTDTDKTSGVFWNEDTAGDLIMKRGKAFGVKRILGKGQILFDSPFQGANISISIPNKDSLRWITSKLSRVLRPGDYLGNDSPYPPLGRKLIKNPKFIPDNPPGYSVDAYNQILNIGNKPNGKYAVRYAIKPSSQFNKLGTSETAQTIINQQNNLSDIWDKREFIDSINKLIGNRGPKAWITVDGTIQIPHPYLLVK